MFKEKVKIIILTIFLSLGATILLPNICVGFNYDSLMDASSYPMTAEYIPSKYIPSNSWDTSLSWDLSSPQPNDFSGIQLTPREPGYIPLNKVGAPYTVAYDIKTEGDIQVEIMPDPADMRQQAISCKWDKPGGLWRLNNRFLMPVKEIDDIVLRFAVSGIKSQFKIILKDDADHQVSILIDDQITTLLHKDGRFTEQYVFIPLKEIKGDASQSFNWENIKQIEFQPVSSQGELLISEFGFFARNKKGVALGVFTGNREHCQSIDSWNGIKPKVIMSFSDIIEDPSELLAKWQRLQTAGHIPMDTWEFWVMYGDKPWDLIEKEKAKFIAKYGDKLYRKVVENQLVTSGKVLGGKVDNNIFTGIIQGDYDPLLRDRAKAVKRFGQPILERPLHEYTGFWYPWALNTVKDQDNFAKAWEHIHRIYQEEGATNAIFVWSPHAKSVWGYRRIEETLQEIAPYVDMIALDAYGLPYDCYRITEMLTGLVRRLRKYGMPIIIGETGSMGEDIKKDPSRSAKKAFFASLDEFLRNTEDISLVTYFDITKQELGTADERTFSPMSDQIQEIQNDSFYQRNFSVKEIIKRDSKQSKELSLVINPYQQMFKDVPYEKRPAEVPHPVVDPSVKIMAIPQIKGQKQPLSLQNGAFYLFQAYANQQSCLLLNDKPVADGHLVSKKQDKSWASAVVKFEQPFDLNRYKIHIKARGRNGGERIAVHAVPIDQEIYGVSDKVLIGPLGKESKEYIIPVKMKSPVSEIGIDFGLMTMINLLVNPDDADIFLEEIKLTPVNSYK